MIATEEHYMWGVMAGSLFTALAFVTLVVYVIKKGRGE